jgi:phosphatidate cytidylyltransferase
MLKQRIITAVILFAVILACLAISQTAFLALTAVAMGCCLWEWLRICGLKSPLAAVVGGAVAAFLFGTALCSAEYARELYSAQTAYVFSAVGTVIWTVLVLVIFLKRVSGWKIPLAIGALLACALVPAAWFSLVWLFTAPSGGILLMLSVLAIVWIADIGAYFVGMSLGGPKMSPGISPKKTWSGAAGAVVLVLGIASALYAFAPEWNLWSNRIFASSGIFASLALLFIVVVFSIAGDLFESVLKRCAGVKDSSNLLPGHGGVYDRIDAQLSVLPLAVFILLFIQGF